MYDELVKRLRAAKAVVFKADDVDLLAQAADAIEGLSKQLDDMNEANIALYGALPKWIPVTERMPKEYDEVLLQFQHNQASGFWNGGCWCVHSGDDFYTEVAEIEGKPTHWTHKLPEPPKEET